MPLVNLPKTQRGQETLDNLCAAAERVFYRKGYHNSTIKDITKEAQIGLGTFYIYFSDKKSLYVYLLSDYSKFIRKASEIAKGPLILRAHRQDDWQQLGGSAKNAYTQVVLG